VVLLAGGRIGTGPPMTARWMITVAYAALAASGVALQLAGRARRRCLVPVGEVIAAVRASLAGRLVLALGWCSGRWCSSCSRGYSSAG
jgi:hypothetical protein